jgi:[ribosomal protein S5]-alanine N-acetyltransferase
MTSQPALTTERLILRPLVLADAPVIQQLAGRREIADTTISIPHPYSEQLAKDWIAAHPDAYAQSKGVTFGVELAEHKQLIGAVGLREIDQEHSQAEMGFWIGINWWGNGYATEAAKSVIRYGFEELSLNRIYAHHMVRNPASGRVLEKVGMKREGLLRQRVRKWGKFEDVVILAILRNDCVKPISWLLPRVIMP